MCHPVPRLVIPIVMLLAIAVATAPAQFKPGDFIVSDFFPTDGISWIDAQTGVITTVLPAASNAAAYDAIAIGPKNDHAVLLRSDGHLLRMADNGIAATMTTWTKPTFPSGAIVVDQDGSLVVAVDNVLRRVRGGQVVATLATGLPIVGGLARDADTGGFVAAEYFAKITRISRAGAVTTVTTITSAFVTLDADQRTGDYWAAFVGRGQFSGIVARYDRTTGREVQRITRPDFDAVVVDPTTGDLLAATGETISRITQGDVTVRTWGPYVGYRFNELAIWGSRKVTGDGTAAPGSVFTVHVRMPESPRATCCSALSFSGARPGLPVGSQTINLAFDGLSFATACGALPQFTSGFLMTLDATGAGTATWQMPAFVPLGTRYTYVAVALNPSSPDGVDVSGALTVVVE